MTIRTSAPWTDFTGPGFTLYGGYVASAIRGNSPNWSVHYLPTFGGGSPLAAYGTYWEPYGRGGKIVKDDSLDASKTIHLEDDAIGGDSTGTLIQVTDKSLVELTNILGMAPGQVELDTNQNAYNAQTWAPSLRWTGSSDGSLPILNTCDRTTPPRNCRNVPAGDPTQPTYVIEGQRRYGTPTAIGEYVLFGGPHRLCPHAGSVPHAHAFNQSRFRLLAGTVPGPALLVLRELSEYSIGNLQRRIAKRRVARRADQFSGHDFRLQVPDTIDCNITPH